jgi:serine/threonine protein kinases, putative
MGVKKNLKAVRLLCFFIMGVVCAFSQDLSGQVRKNSLNTGTPPRCEAKEDAAEEPLDRTDTARWSDALWKRIDRAYQLQRYDEALRWLDSLGLLLSPWSEPNALLKYFAWKGDVHYRLGQISHALKAFRAALGVQTRDPRWELFSAYIGLGTIYGQFNYDEKALWSFQHADSVLIARGNSNGRSFLFINMAEIYMREGKYGKALCACYDAQLCLKKRYDDLVALLHVNMSCIYAKLGRYDLLKAHSDFALKYTEARGNELLRQEVYVKLAGAWHDAGNEEQAYALLQAEKALGIGLPTGDVYKLLLKIMSTHLESEGNYRMAAFALDAYMCYDDSIKSSLAQVDFADAALTDELLLMRDWQRKQMEQLEQRQRDDRWHYRKVSLQLVALLSLMVGVWLTMYMVRSRRLQAVVNVQEAADRLAVVNASVEHQQEQIREQREAIIQQRVALEQSKQMLQLTGKKFRNDLGYVLNLQGALLPSQERMQRILGEAFALYLPRDVVSGDFYSCHAVGDVKVFAVFDCAGHGIPGALMSFIGTILMRKVIREAQEIEPAGLLTRLHELMKQYLRDERGSGVGFYTMDASIAVWHAKERRLVLSSACRTAYLYTEGVMHAYRGVIMSVGSKLVEREYVNDEIDVPTSAMLYLSTDGYADQMDDENRKYGSVRFINLLTDVAAFPMQEQKARLLREFESYRAKTIQTDDVCVLGIRLGGEEV